MAVLPSTGELNRRIQIREKTDVPNGGFGVDETFAAGITRWAKREPVYGLALRAGANVGEVPTDLFWVRRATGTKPEDITTGHVIDLDGRRFRVLDTIDVNGLQRFTRISAKDLGVIPP